MPLDNFEYNLENSKVGDLITEFSLISKYGRSYERQIGYEIVKVTGKQVIMNKLKHMNAVNRNKGYDYNYIIGKYDCDGDKIVQKRIGKNSKRLIAFYRGETLRHEN